MTGRTKYCLVRLLFFLAFTVVCSCEDEPVQPKFRSVDKNKGKSGKNPRSKAKNRPVKKEAGGAEQDSSAGRV